MSTSAAASGRRRRRRRRGRLPDCILLDAYGNTGDERNGCTALGKTRNKHTIQVTLRAARPPAPTKLFAYCPGAGVRINSKARIVRSDDDLLLFHVAVDTGHRVRSAHYTDLEFFVYRAGRRPSLTPLPTPPARDSAVGLLRRRGHDAYTVATLFPRSANDYNLHRFDSDSSAAADSGPRWKVIPLHAPPRATPPVKIPADPADRLFRHQTNAVIALGGEAGTMGWVDLWSGILLCDLFPQQHDAIVELRHVPLPLPMDLITCNNGMGAELGCPKSRRGIAVCVKGDKSILKLAELRLTVEMLPYTDSETGEPAYRIADWGITTWSNIKMSNSYNDWHEDFSIQASKIEISAAMRSRLLASGILHCEPSARVDDGSKEEAAAPGLAFNNILVLAPTPSLSGEEEDVVYVMAKTKLLHPKAWILAVDMKNNTLQGLAEFPSENAWGVTVNYFPSNISKHMDPAITPVTSAP